VAADGGKGEGCPRCGAPYDEAAVRAALMTCPGCRWHYRMEPGERVAYLADEGSFVELFAGVSSRNPIGLAGYGEKLEESRARSGGGEAILTGACTVEGRPLILGAMSFRFMGGSMGSAVGEKVSRAMLKGAGEGTPVAIFTTSGGARMQEGIFSLMQMAKTASAAAEMDRARVPYFVVLCDPTTGGVTASYAMLGDVTLAEPGALIGFAGPRVIEGTIRQTLPEGFQRAEFLLEKGFVDAIVPRWEQRRALAALIDLHGGARQ